MSDPPPVIRADPACEERELREYLGEDFDACSLQDWAGVLEAEAREIGDEQRLYRSSAAYLYNLTVFAMSKTKIPYLKLLCATVPRGARLLDYGCGIGSDGLMLLEAGFDVSFADFDNPSTRYLRWRLARRGLRARIYDLDEGPPEGDFDLVYAFDVIEHVDDPFAFLRAMEEQAPLVLVNLLEFDPMDTHLHRDLPIRQLVRRTAAMDLRAYHRFHEGRSHVLLYCRDQASGIERLRSSVRGIWGRRRPGYVRSGVRKVLQRIASELRARRQQ